MHSVRQLTGFDHGATATYVALDLEVDPRHGPQRRSTRGEYIQPQTYAGAYFTRRAHHTHTYAMLHKRHLLPPLPLAPIHPHCPPPQTHPSFNPVPPPPPKQKSPALAALTAARAAGPAGSFASSSGYRQKQLRPVLVGASGPFARAAREAGRGGGSSAGGSVRSGGSGSSRGGSSRGGSSRGGSSRNGRERG